MVQESPELASFKRKAGQLDKEMRYMDEVHTAPSRFHYCLLAWQVRDSCERFGHGSGLRGALPRGTIQDCIS